ncbi:hypothetical protein ACTXT7_006410 [Hymenolepis weldensis]
MPFYEEEKDPERKNNKYDIQGLGGECLKTFQSGLEGAEVGFEAMRAEHVALKEASSQGITIDRNHMIGLLVGIILGAVCTLFSIFLVARFCRPSRRRNHPGRLRFYNESRSISNIQLESQIRHSLLHDPTVYANPSPIDQSMHSNSSLRYNFLLRQSPPRSLERIPRSEEISHTTGFYDRLSENFTLTQLITKVTQSDYAHPPPRSSSPAFTRTRPDFPPILLRPDDANPSSFLIYSSLA